MRNIWLEEYEELIGVDIKGADYTLDVHTACPGIHDIIDIPCAIS